MSSESRVAIVTGASRGIGKQIALRLARNGINLVLAARTLEAGQGRWPGSLEETAAQARELGVEASPVKCDVTQRGEVEAMCQTALAKHGCVDILVNNALYLGDGRSAPRSDPQPDFGGGDHQRRYAGRTGNRGAIRGLQGGVKSLCRGAGA
jgi:NAD(P)-dependent dehydrogenase (short-subunit alcohol dehydrogenase family)